MSRGGSFSIPWIRPHSHSPQRLLYQKRIVPPGTIAESLAPPKVKGSPLAATFPWSAALQTVRRTYPEAELRTIGIPTRPGELVRIRVRQPAEWLPSGRTIFWFDPADGRLLEVRDARSLPLATRAFNLVYPIHASTIGGLAYKAPGCLWILELSNAPYDARLCARGAPERLIVGCLQANWEACRKEGEGAHPAEQNTVKDHTYFGSRESSRHVKHRVWLRSTHTSGV